MGFLDEVIRSVLSSQAEPAQTPAAPAQQQSVQDPLSQITAALIALLAPRPGAGTSEQAPASSAAPQGSLGGLDVLINQFKNNGFEDVINSWIGTGQNRPISPSQLHQALGSESLSNLSRQTGAPQQDLVSQLSKYLPAVVDRLTPNGQVPSQPDLRSGYRAS